MWPIIGAEPVVAKAMASALGYVIGRKKEHVDKTMHPHAFLIFDPPTGGATQVAIAEMSSDDLEDRVNAMRGLVKTVGKPRVHLLLHSYEAWIHTSDDVLQSLRFGTPLTPAPAGQYVRLDAITVICWKPDSAAPAAMAWVNLDDEGLPVDILPATDVGGKLTAASAYAKLWQ